MLDVAMLFMMIFVLNVIPAFAPPTWMVLSFIGLQHPPAHITLLALIGAVAATLGRFTLAKLSRVIIRQKLLSTTTRHNIDAIRDGLEHRRALTVGLFLFYAFSPLPSNVLFIAYGLTPLKYRLIAIPFLLGRFVSYNFWVFTTAAAARYLVLESTEAQSYLGGYFIVSQLLLLATVYVFTRIDWRALFVERRLRWLKDVHP